MYSVCRKFNMPFSVSLCAFSISSDWRLSVANLYLSYLLLWQWSSEGEHASYADNWFWADGKVGASTTKAGQDRMTRQVDREPTLVNNGRASVDPRNDHAITQVNACSASSRSKEPTTSAMKWQRHIGMKGYRVRPTNFLLSSIDCAETFLVNLHYCNKINWLIKPKPPSISFSVNVAYIVSWNCRGFEF